MPGILRTSLPALLYMAMLAVPVHSQGVDAIVTEESTVVDINSDAAYTCSKHKSVLILNADGAHHASYQIYLRDGMSLDKFAITLTDGTGRVLRTYKQKDLKRTELSEGLAEDGYHLYLDVTPPSYPIVATCDTKVSSKRNNITYPIFSPLDSYNTKVASATYDITYPTGYPLRYKAVNTTVTPTETIKDGKSSLHFVMDSIGVFQNSRYGLPLSEVSPKVYFAPTQFAYYKTKGSLQSWHDLGAWEHTLFKGRDELPDAAKAKVRSLTAGCATVKERVAAIYGYLAESTRYVSIQLGIGGYQPMPAAEVWRQGFGDCKALSNYMMSLLAEAGIESHCAAISTQHERLLEDFPNFQQMNHMILEVPLDGDTIWIECTNPQLPLAYVHDDISGHQALEISADGGKIVTLPEYPDTLNANITEARVRLSADGSADIAVSEEFRCHRYMSMRGLVKLSDNDLRKAIFAIYHLPQSEITDLSVKDKSQPYGVPTLAYDFAAHSAKYSSITGSRLFVPTNLLHKNYRAAADSHLANELDIVHGSQNRETIVFEIPEGYTIESLPESSRQTLPFADFRSTVTAEGNTITITYDYRIDHGTYPGMAQQYNDFEKKISEAYARKIVLKKAQ